MDNPAPQTTQQPVPILRLLIADDHPLVRKGMRTLLGAVPDFAIVGEAATGAGAIAAAADVQPDVILMDIQMPEGSGIAATRAILQDHPAIKILVVTLFEDDDSVFTALRAGARGYILKDADEDEIVRAIRAVGAGEAIFSPAIATRVLSYFSAPRIERAPQIFPDLTEREREILHLIARGHNNPAIARSLSIAPKTVANHVSNIFAKLQVADRAEAIIRARDAGLGHG
jgi:DNA-binding NarL/FixJ family response regulator